VFTPKPFPLKNGSFFSYATHRQKNFYAFFASKKQSGKNLRFLYEKPLKKRNHLLEFFCSIFPKHLALFIFFLARKFQKKIP
jgi:hypothetical protein